jgi:hypothetical protein
MARRAVEQRAAQRQAARRGPLKLVHRVERRADARRQPRASPAPLGARNRLAQLVVRERCGELVVLGELRGDEHEQLSVQVQQTHRPRGSDDANGHGRIARRRDGARKCRPRALHPGHTRVDALQLPTHARELRAHRAHLRAHLQQQAEQLGRCRILSRGLKSLVVRARALARRHPRTGFSGDCPNPC